MMETIDKITSRGNVTDGHRRTHAARQANKMRKWRRWAEELRLNGWSVTEPSEGESSEDQAR